MKHSTLKILLPVLTVLLLGGCTGYPKTVTPVDGFELDRYLGKWYEIARLDHSFERGLSNVTAEYQLREDGGVAVINRGYLAEEEEWKQAEGRAYFVDDTDKAHLKVSFFGPFYGSYVVFELDEENYQYAFVSGPDTDYLWLLARSPLLDDGLIEHFRQTASRRGFDADSLIIVEHDRQ